MPRRSDSDETRSDAANLSAEERDELLDDDFKTALKELAEGYKPFLEADLKRAQSAPDALIKDAAANPTTCEEEFAQAEALFAKFTSEEVAPKLLPAAVRDFLGPIDRWRWCLLHVRCCLVFGWLLCRRPRTFRASIYYLYRYWRCVREVLGAPVSHPPTPAERKDFLDLVKAMAKAYQPYLRDQLAAAEFPAGLPDEVFGGAIDCDEGADAQVRILEQLLTTDTARALLGAEVLAQHRQDAFFWFCRCWCLCAIRLGCCLARARTLKDLVRCLRWYRRCLADCFRRLACDLQSPSGCVRGYTDIVPGRILEPVVGSAEGSIFARYLIEVRDPGGDLLSNVVIYPDSVGNPDLAAVQGNFVVSGGTLGWVDVHKCAVDAGVDLLTSTTFELKLRVFGTDGSELSPPCVTTFSLSVNETFIKWVGGATSVDYLSPPEPLRVGGSSSDPLATVGGQVSVAGAANVYGCLGEKIREYNLWAIPDPSFSFAQPAAYSSVTPGPNWVLLSHIEFTPQTIPQPVGPPIAYTADQVRSYNVLDGDPTPSALINTWGTRNECITVVVDFTTVTFCWRVPSLHAHSMNSNALLQPFRLNPALHQGGTGKFTLLLQVIDTSGNTFYDVQRAWIDNEPIQGLISGLSGLPACDDLYTMNQGGMFKTVNVEGYAWDELIEPGNLAQPTSDNFEHYTVHFAKQGVPGAVQLIDSASPVPPRPMPLAIGSLVSWNLQTLDALTNPLALPPPLSNHLLDRGESCTYNVILRAWDKTLVNNATTVHHTGPILFPVKIINGPEP